MNDSDLEKSEDNTITTTVDPPDGCCLRQCFLSKCFEKNKEKLTKKKKLTLFVSDKIATEINFNVQNKPRKKTVTSIMEPQIFLSQSLFQSRSHQRKLLQKSCTVEFQSIQPKLISSLAYNPNASVSTNVEFPKFNQSTFEKIIKQKQINKISLNSIRPSKIIINKQVINKQPNDVTSITIINHQSPKVNKSCESVETLNISSLPLVVSMQAEDQKFKNHDVGLTPEKRTFVTQLFSDLNIKQVQSPLFNKSSQVSFVERRSFQNHNASQIILKLPFIKQIDTINQLQFVENNFSYDNIKNNKRIMTFAEEVKSQELSIDDNRLSGILKSFKKIVQFQQFFNRGGFIGSGRISSVYRVEQKQTKFIFSSKEVFKKIVYENNLLNEIDKSIQEHYSLPFHDNVISLYGTFQDTGRYYFITQLCQTNLRNIIKSSNISQQKALFYLQHIMYGLRHLHKNKIIHKHLKPQNILLNYDICKISGFGWAAKLLQMNNHLPNYEYCFQQTMNYKMQLDEKADCWSLGIIAFQMIFGTIPVLSQPNIVLSNKQKIQTLCDTYRELLKGLLNPITQDRLNIYEALNILKSYKKKSSNISEQILF